MQKKKSFCDELLCLGGLPTAYSRYVKVRCFQLRTRSSDVCQEVIITLQQIKADLPSRAAEFLCSSVYLPAGME
jgi:hypothetical protein